MTIDLIDNFNYFPGQFAGYDTTISQSAANRDIILANDHVDLRVFNQQAVIRRRTQIELDNTPQSGLDARTQSDIESIVLSAGENWTSSGTGFGNFTVGTQSSLNNWHGARFTGTGAALNMTLLSSMAQSSSPPIDISAMDFLSLVISTTAFASLNLASCNIQLTSSVAGTFGTSTSNTVAFSSNTSGTTTEIRLNATSFDRPFFDRSKVTGVKITLVSTGTVANGTAFVLLALRAAKTGWQPFSLDLDTRRGAVVSAVTLNAAAPTSILPIMIRGNKWEASAGAGDPRPIDIATTQRFQVGSLAFSSSGTPNIIDLIFREKRDASAGTGSWITARLNFWSGNATAQTFKTNVTGTTTATVDPASTINYTGLPALNNSGLNNGWYIFQGDLTAQTLKLNLYTSDENGTLGTLIWSSASTGLDTNPAYTREQGRAGWWASLPDRDTVIDNFGAAATSFSILQSKVFESYTPVIGAQLHAAFALDSNLFQDFQGADPASGGLSTDTNRALSNFSYRSQLPIQSNSFFVEDWNQTYISLSMWVPAQFDPSNQPYVVLRSQEALITVSLPKPVLQSNLWTDVNIDLAVVQGAPTGVFYQMYIESGDNVKTPYAWNVDNIKIGRRNISWQIRAISNGTWREFRDSVNDPVGAVHFPPEERGTELQIQAVALTQQAWVSSYQLFPTYAQLGKPLYYQ